VRASISPPPKGGWGARKEDGGTKRVAPEGTRERPTARTKALKPAENAQTGVGLALLKLKSAVALAESRGWKNSVGQYQELRARLTSIARTKPISQEDLASVSAEIDQAIARDEARWQDEIGHDARLLEQIFSNHRGDASAAYAAVRQRSSNFRKVGEVARDQNFGARSNEHADALGPRFRAQYGVARADFNRSIVESHGAAWSDRAALYREIASRYTAAAESAGLALADLQPIHDGLQALLDADKATWVRQTEEDQRFLSHIFEHYKGDPIGASQKFRELFFTYQREFQAERAQLLRTGASNAAGKIGIRWVTKFHAAGARENVAEAERRGLTEVRNRWEKIVERYTVLERMSGPSMEVLNGVRKDDKALLEETGPSLWCEEVSPDVLENPAGPFPLVSAEEQYWLSGRADRSTSPNSQAVDPILPDPRGGSRATKKKK
jgi:hypothetical protein